jgi:thioredoxin 1
MTRRISSGRALLAAIAWCMSDFPVARGAAAHGTSLVIAIRHIPWTVLRGGNQEELTLDQKVRAAMQKLGISPPPPPPPTEDAVEDGFVSREYSIGNDGVDGSSSMAIESEKQENESTAIGEDILAGTEFEDSQETPEDAGTIAARLSEEMSVVRSLVCAALEATATTTGGSGNNRKYNENAAREMIQQELDMISQISEDSEDVELLVSEGFDVFLSRRALAFAERNIDDARAILLADKMDAEEEDFERGQQELEDAPTFQSVVVAADFDPTKLGTTEPASATPPFAPTPANKADVVFDATSSQIQELVLESPVPVLVDVYADWCGPCKALTPALEEMAVKAGGAFRLVKVNTDNENAISAALGVKALPTIFGVKDGKIQHMFEGMPKSPEAMKSFMMGLLMGGGYDPPVPPSKLKEYSELSSKLLKAAGTASFSFSARERLHDRTSARLYELEKEAGVLQAEVAASTIRSLLSNIVRDPFDPRFRKVNLTNSAISERVAKYPTAVAILKGAGFVLDSSTHTMSVGKGKKVVNLAPLSVVRDCIDKWIERTRYEVAKAARKQKDEEDRLKLLAEAKPAGDVAEYDEEEYEEAKQIDPDACTLQLRIDGKKKVHTIALRADDTLVSLIGKLPTATEEGQEVQITCVAKRLVVKSSDELMMRKTLRDLGLSPSAAIVVKLVDTANPSVTSSKLSERAAIQKKRKKGSHTMQSIGIYSKDDNNKAELVDGGGGTCYEQDISDEEQDEDAGGEKDAEEVSIPDEEGE